MRRSTRWDARDESGFALILVMGLASIFTVAALSSLMLSQQTVNNIERGIRTQNAFQAANAGIDRALARLIANPATDLDWPLVGTVGDATYSVVTTLSPSATTATYTVTATGTFRGTTQTVSQQYAQTVVPSFSLWDKYLFTDEGFNAANGWSTTNYWGSAYVAGDLNIAGLGGLPADVAARAFTNNIYVYNGQCYVKKGVDSTYAPMNLLANASQTHQNPITSGRFATWSTDCPMIVLPKFGLEELRSKWATVTAAGRVPSVAPEPTSLTPGNHPLTITAATLDTTYSVVGSQTRLKWTRLGGNGKGLLTVDGVVYIDGNLTLPDCNYTGRGTLVVRGNVTLTGGLLPKNGQLVMNNPPQYTPLSPSEVLGIITPFDMSADPGPGNNTRKDYKGDFGMAGAFYVGGTVTFLSNNNRVKGTMIAGGCDADGHNVHLVVDPDMPDMLPPEMPGIDGIPQTVVFQRLFNTWSRR